MTSRVLKLDHITVIAPTLTEGVAHVRDCLGIDVPFGTCHEYMGTHNHRLQLGNNVYLEIVALDPDGTPPRRARWFGLDNQRRVKSDWDAGRRLRGWVANTAAMDAVVASHHAIFGDKVPLPTDAPTFDFAIPRDGSLPLDGVAPSIIDHRGDPTSMTSIPDLGARLRTLTLQHPTPGFVESLYREIAIADPPAVTPGPEIRYRAYIETTARPRELT